MDITSQVTGAEEVVWDLSDLYSSIEDQQFVSDLGSMVQRCSDFRSKWKGTLASLKDADIATMMSEYAQLVEDLDRLGSFVHLVWSTDTENPANGRALQHTREVGAQAGQFLIFVTIELAELSDERLDQLMNSAVLAHIKHWFEGLRESKPYQLTEEVERALAIKGLTSRFAWVRMHDEVMNAQVFKLNGRDYTEAEVMKLLQEPDRNTRKAAAESLSVGLAESVRQQAYIFNTVIADHASDDKLRGFPSWIAHRNLANEATDESVQALIDSVVKRNNLMHRYYNLKKRLLGIDTMREYDRNAPIGKDQSFWTWDAARELVVSAYTEFHPRVGEIAQMFFDKSWIHAPARKGKSGGAYSAGTIASAHPYVFLNYMGTNRDVQVLAHELGHGVHQYLSRKQGPLLMDTPLTVAETASVFGEIITFNKLYDATQDDTQRLNMLMGKIDDVVSTVFRQIHLNRFEEAIHIARRTQGELSVDKLSDIWMSTQSENYGDSVSLSDGYRYWWSYISHFMHVPGYVYAYAYGELLVLSLYDIYKQQQDTFPEMYLEMLSTGGAKRPSELLKPFGIDVEDPAFWNIGLNVIDRLVTEAERLAG